MANEKRLIDAFSLEHKKKISESMKRHFAEKNCPNCGAKMRGNEE